jgi:hypothetical protein
VNQNTLDEIRSNCKDLSDELDRSIPQADSLNDDAIRKAADTKASKTEAQKVLQHNNAVYEQAEMLEIDVEQASFDFEDKQEELDETNDNLDEKIEEVIYSQLKGVVNAKLAKNVVL